LELSNGLSATAVDVERVFSHGRGTLSYSRNHLSVQTARALICVGEGFKVGLIGDKELLKCLRGLEDVDEEDESDVRDGWDRIQ
jgi:hypothetical protein